MWTFSVRFLTTRIACFVHQVVTPNAVRCHKIPGIILHHSIKFHCSCAAIKFSWSYEICFGSSEVYTSGGATVWRGRAPPDMKLFLPDRKLLEPDQKYSKNFLY